MSKRNNFIDVRVLTKVSSLYYNHGYNQQDIADRLHLSRPKVSRLLKQAREQGIVQISVVTPNGYFVALESALEEKYNLKEVLLVESDGQMSDQVVKKQIGSAAANYLYRTISAGDCIGVTWGTTLQAMVDALQPRPIEDIKIVQTLGGVGPPEAKTHTADISRRLSQLLNGRLTLLPAPGIVGSIQAKKVLLEDRKVQNALDMFPKINTLYVGIGALETNPVLTKDQREIPEEVCQKVLGSEAVGDIALRFFDIQGKEVDVGLDKYIIGISLKEIQKIDTVVGIAGGYQKTDVIRGALNGKYIDVLITDNNTAEELLE